MVPGKYSYSEFPLNEKIDFLAAKFDHRNRHQKLQGSKKFFLSFPDGRVELRKGAMGFAVAAFFEQAIRRNCFVLIKQVKLDDSWNSLVFDLSSSV